MIGLRVVRKSDKSVWTITGSDGPYEWVLSPVEFGSPESVSLTALQALYTLPNDEAVPRLRPRTRNIARLS